MLGARRERHHRDGRRRLRLRSAAWITLFGIAWSAIAFRTAPDEHDPPTALRSAGTYEKVDHGSVGHRVGPSAAAIGFVRAAHFGHPIAVVQLRR